jgi:hypothetical protein
MVDAREAKRILLDLRRKNRERQKEWKASMEAQGYRRISVMISAEASRILSEEAKRLDQSKGNVLSDIITNCHKQRNQYISGNTRKTKAPRMAEAGEGKPYDKAAAVKRITELSAQGMSHREIAEKLDAENIPSARGGKWNRGTIAKMIPKKATN